MHIFAHRFISFGYSDKLNLRSQYGERGGSVVACQTPEREVGGSKPTATVLCP